MFGYWQFTQEDFFGFYLPRIIVTLFLLSSGLSLNLQSSPPSVKENAQKLMPRFWKLVFFALIISLVTRVMFPNNWIYFGTLHCLAALTLIAIFFRGRPLAAFICGSLVQLNYFTGFEMVDPLEVWVSIKSVDFIPIYPWSGVFLIGMGLSPLVSRLKLSVPKMVASPLSLVSQKSLPIYLLHQPIIYSSILLFNSLKQ